MAKRDKTHDECQHRDLGSRVIVDPFYTLRTVVEFSMAMSVGGAVVAAAVPVVLFVRAVAGHGGRQCARALERREMETRGYLE